MGFYSRCCDPISLAAAAWLLAATSSRRFDIGTNQDSSIFWDRASWGFHRLHEVHDYPFFPAINFYIYDFSSGLGPPAYLAAVQVPLLAGALAGVFAFVFVKEIATQRVAKIVSLLFILSPIVITFSTGLVRDTLICMFGLATLAGLMRIRRLGMTSLKTPIWLCFVVLSLIALYNLRLMSFYLILCQASLCCTWFKANPVKRRLRF